MGIESQIESGKAEAPVELTRAAVQARPVVAQAVAPQVFVPQYAAGFDGASMSPFPEKAIAVLGESVNEEEVELRDDGIVFMPGVWYRRQLFRAFGPGAWALLPRGPERTDGQTVLYKGGLYVLGRFVSEAVGECEKRWGMSYASALEGARTDCLSRCCKDLGMAAELWDKAWRDSWLAKYSVKEWRNPTEAQLRENPKARGRWFFSRVDGKKDAELVEGRNAGQEVEPAQGSRKCEFCGGWTVGNMRGRCAKGAKADTDAAVAATIEANCPKGEPSESGPRESARTQGSSSASGASHSRAPHDSPPDDVPSIPVDRPGDTGEAPNPVVITELQRMAKALKWSGPHARNWLKKHFGVESSGALTADQATAAHEMLEAAMVDDEDRTYSEVRDRLIAAGRVRG